MKIGLIGQDFGSSILDYLSGYDVERINLNSVIDVDLVMLNIDDVELVENTYKLYPRTLKFGFQRYNWWNYTHYADSSDIQKIMAKIDCVWGWTDNLLLAANNQKKPIWDFPLLPSQLNEIITFNPANFDNKKYIVSVNGYNPYNSFKLGHSIELMETLVTEENHQYCVRISKQHPEEKEIFANYDNIIGRIDTQEVIWIEFLQKNSYMLFQLSPVPSMGRTIFQASHLGLPCVASGYYYQKILYPDLIVNSTEEAQKILSWDYTEFEPYVEKAQKEIAQFSPDNSDGLIRFNDYFGTFVKGL